MVCSILSGIYNRLNNLSRGVRVTVRVTGSIIFHRNNNMYLRIYVYIYKYIMCYTYEYAVLYTFYKTCEVINTHNTIGGIEICTLFVKKKKL